MGLSQLTVHLPQEDDEQLARRLQEEVEASSPSFLNDDCWPEPQTTPSSKKHIWSDLKCCVFQILSDEPLESAAIRVSLKRFTMLLLLTTIAVANGHPFAPTCHGFGGSNCLSASPGDSGKRRGSGFAGTTLAVRVELPGCFLKSCWLQAIRVGVDESNSVEGPAKMGVYLSDGNLVTTSEEQKMPTSLQDHAWLSFPLLGYDQEPNLRSIQFLHFCWSFLYFCDYYAVAHSAGWNKYQVNLLRLVALLQLLRSWSVTWWCFCVSWVGLCSLVLSLNSHSKGNQLASSLNSKPNSTILFFIHFSFPKCQIY